MPTIGKGIVEAVRYNGALEAGRLPPAALGKRAFTSRWIAAARPPKK